MKKRVLSILLIMSIITSIFTVSAATADAAVKPATPSVTIVNGGSANGLYVKWNSVGNKASYQVAYRPAGSYQLLILKPTVLKNEYRTPDFQLFYATDGFGCDPKKIGARVFGFFLKDDEFTSFRRHDFYGVANDAALPEWALEKLNEIRDKLDMDDSDTAMEVNPT